MRVLSCPIEEVWVGSVVPQVQEGVPEVQEEGERGVPKVEGQGLRPGQGDRLDGAVQVEETAEGMPGGEPLAGEGQARGPQGDPRAQGEDTWTRWRTGTGR